MRFRVISAAALAALALSGLFASAAMAEEENEGSPEHPGMGSLIVCDSTEAGEQYMASHSHSVAEERQAWHEVVAPEECAPRVWGTDEELDAIDHRVVQCFEAHQDESGSGRPLAERCVAIATTGGDAASSGHAGRKPRHAKRAHRRRHATKR